MKRIPDQDVESQPAIYTGDIVRHVRTGRVGIVLAILPTQGNDSIEYQVRTSYPGAALDGGPGDFCYKMWWKSQLSEWVGGKDPYRRYLALCAAEDDPARRDRRATHPSHKIRKYVGLLPEKLWEKMFWQLTNRRRLLPSGLYVSFPLGRDHWIDTASDCLNRRDKSAGR